MPRTPEQPAPSQLDQLHEEFAAHVALGNHGDNVHDFLRKQNAPAQRAWNHKMQRYENGADDIVVGPDPTNHFASKTGKKRLSDPKAELTEDDFRYRQFQNEESGPKEKDALNHLGDSNPDDKQATNQENQPKSELDQLKEQVEALTAQVDQLTQAVEHLVAENQALRAENERLKQQLAGNGEQPAEQVDEPEQEKGFEIYTLRDAIDPENILKMREAMNAEWADTVAEMTDDQKKNQNLMQAEYLANFETYMHEYLKNLNPEEVDLEAIRVHVSSLMQSQYLDQLMLKPENGETGVKKSEEITKPVDEGEDKTAITDKSKKGVWNRVKNFFNHPVYNTYNYIQTAGIGKDDDGKAIIPAVPPEQVPPYEEASEPERRRRCLWPVIGALVVGGGLGYLLSKYGMPWQWGGGGGGAVPPPTGHGSKQTVEFANEWSGNQNVGVITDQGWHLNQNMPDGGNYITAPDGATYATAAGNHGVWQSDHDLSRGAMDFVKQHGGTVTQEQLEIPGRAGETITRNITEIHNATN